MPRLDSYSQLFAERLFAAFPEWCAFASTRVQGESNEGFLEVKVPAPVAGPTPVGEDDFLWIDTDGEITVGFDAFHTHFDSFADSSQDEEFARAIEFVRDLVEEKICVVFVRRGDEWRGSTTCEPGQEPDLSSFSHFDTLHIRSWKGSHNHIEERLWVPDTFALDKLHRVLDLVREPVIEATAAKVATERQLKELHQTIDQNPNFAFILLCNNIAGSGCALSSEAYVLLEIVGEHLLKHPTSSGFPINRAMWETLKPQSQT